jgi:hypothetical protein
LLILGGWLLLKEGNSMTKRTWVKIAGALAVTSLATMALAADHRDSLVVKADPPSDINDVYTWVAKDKVVIAMTVFPAAPKEAKFSDKTQYVIHTTSGKAFGEAASKLDIVCTFDAAQMITCKAGEGPGLPVMDMVTGDASAEAGIESDSKMIKVFAGPRKDPFYFNLDGFGKTVEIVVGAAPGLMADAAGCPALDAATSMMLVTQLKSDPMGGPAKDFFAPLNGLAIVLELDKSLMTAGGPILSIWGATHAAPAAQ